MKLCILMENTAFEERFRVEHGLSLLLQTETHKILFDMGQTDSFTENARMLGIELSQVDLAVLSHGHYDHSGGIKRFLELNEKAPVYISPWVFDGHYNADGKDIGLDLHLRDSNRLIPVEDGQLIGEGLTLYNCNSFPLHTEMISFGLSAMVDGKMIPEDFRHEQYLLIEEGSRRILVSGCSHKRILNLAHWFKPDILIGGFHFMKLNPNSDDKELLQEAAEELLQYPTIYYSGHCTGDLQFGFLKEIMGDRLNRISAGMELTI